MERKCHELLEKHVFKFDQIPDSSQKIASEVLFDQLIWNVLAPIVVALSSGIAIEVVKQRLKRIRSGKQNLENGEITITDGIATDQKFEECVTQVTKTLEHYGTTKETTEIIIKEIIKETKITRPHKI
jgi:hypothetical protein